MAVYVHWPYCARICPYCDFNVVRARGGDQPAALGRAVLRDLAGQAAGLGPRRLSSIFFGGGTPSLMTPDQVGEIIAAARALWPGDQPVEITLEANPTDAEAGRFAGFADAGVNRLSLGVQSLDDAALAFLGRDHDAAQARRALAVARAAFEQVSIDLIYARPGQGAGDWARELADAVALGPSHVSPYQLTIEPGTAFARAVARGAMTPVDEDTAFALYETTQDLLSAAGFEAYEVSNHARGRAARSRHNLAYWRGWDYLGVGPGAHGRLSLAGGRVATTTARKAGDYIARVEATGVGVVDRSRLSPREAATERLLMGLRTDEGVAWSELAALGLTPDHPAVADLAEGGWLALAAGGVAATPKGRRVLDHVTGALATAPQEVAALGR
ncbi:MAG TPA: radical SAM family heme chaperone HemW [Caulobacteraceae bacterium]|nr:radical SAM family heme chaperone HemW [Caulobacteraceae bacterium]